MKQIKKLAKAEHTLHAIFAVQQNHYKMATTLHLQNSKDKRQKTMVLGLACFRLSDSKDDA